MPCGYSVPYIDGVWNPVKHSSLLLLLLFDLMSNSMSIIWIKILHILPLQRTHCMHGIR